MLMTGSVSGVDPPDLDDCLRLETEFEDDDFTEGDPDFSMAHMVKESTCFEGLFLMTESATQRF